MENSDNDKESDVLEVGDENNDSPVKMKSSVLQNSAMFKSTQN